MSFLQHIDDITKYTVYGWIREVEKALNLDPIPNEIILICISYYHEEEMWSEIGGNNELSGKGKIVERLKTTRSWGDCNHGSIFIESTANCICRWDLKVWKLKSGGMQLGIVSDPAQREYFTAIKDGSFYIYWNSGYTFNNDKTLTEYEWTWNKCDQKYRKGDEISIILDLKERKVTFLVNGTDANNGYENIEIGDKIKYQLFSAMHFAGDCVEILKFNRFF